MKQKDYSGVKTKLEKPKVRQGGTPGTTILRARINTEIPQGITIMAALQHTETATKNQQGTEQEHTLKCTTNKPRQGTDEKHNKSIGHQGHGAIRNRWG